MAPPRDGACQIATLGMFIIDVFRFEDENTGQDLGDRGMGEQIGGGGTYFVVGARMWLDPQCIEMIIDRGHDFPSGVQEALSRYAQPAISGQHSLWHYRQRTDGTTRAVNVYRGEERGFEYLTRKIRLDPCDLLDNEFEHLPRFIHCVCSPERVVEICRQVQSFEDRWTNGKRPYIVWEPIPDSAVSSNLLATLELAKSIDVLSPNHEEAASLLGLSQDLVRHAGPSIRRKNIEAALIDLQQGIAKHFKDKSDKLPIICIRSGALGALVSSRTANEKAWVEAYHRPEEVHKVVEVTGAGNAWLGGFTAGLACLDADISNWTLDDIVEAGRMGSVSASFTIEQSGLPPMTLEEGDKKTLWNGELAKDRLRRLQQKPGEDNLA